MYIFKKLQRYKYNLQKKRKKKRKKVKDEYHCRIENDLPKTIIYKYKVFFIKNLMWLESTFKHIFNNKAS